MWDTPGFASDAGWSCDLISVTLGACMGGLWYVVFVFVRYETKSQDFQLTDFSKTVSLECFFLFHMHSPCVKVHVRYAAHMILQQQYVILHAVPAQ